MTTENLFEYSPATGLRLKHPSGGGGTRLREVEPAGANHRQGGGRAIHEEDARTSREFAESIRSIGSDRLSKQREDTPNPATIFAKSISS